MIDLAVITDFLQYSRRTIYAIPLALQNTSFKVCRF